MNDELEFTVKVQRPLLLWQQIERYLTTNGYEKITTDESQYQEWRVKGREDSYLMRYPQEDCMRAGTQQRMLERIAWDEGRTALEVYEDIARMPIVVMGEST